MALLFSNGFEFAKAAVPIGDASTSESGINALISNGFNVPTLPSYPAEIAISTEARYPGGKILRGEALRPTGSSVLNQGTTCFQVAAPIKKFKNFMEMTEIGNGVTMGFAGQITTNTSLVVPTSYGPLSFGFGVENTSYSSAILAYCTNTGWYIRMDSRMQSGGDLSINVAHSVTGFVVDSTWHYYELALVKGSTTNSFLVRLYVDGIKYLESNEYTWSGIFAAMQPYVGIQLGDTSVSQVINNRKTYNIDDMYVADRTGNYNNEEYVGEIQIRRRAPTNDVTTQWSISPSDAASHASVVGTDNIAQRTSRVYASNNNLEDLYSSTDQISSTLAGTIRGVNVNVMALRANLLDAKIAPILSDGNTVLVSEGVVPPVVQGGMTTTTYETNPFTNEPFTYEQVNATQFGMRRIV